jgi:hypothetical protein
LLSLKKLASPGADGYAFKLILQAIPEMRGRWNVLCALWDDRELWLG